MARTFTKRNIRNNVSVVASLPRRVISEETLPYLGRIFASARAVRDSHDSVNARYGRDFQGQLLIPKADYKNLCGWFRIALRQRDVMITNKNKKHIVNSCMSFIKEGTLHDVCGVSWFVEGQQWHERYALSHDKLQELVFRILIAEGIVNGVHD